MLLKEQYVYILEEFLRDYTTSLTGSFISKKRNINQKTVANFLNKLEKETILKSKIEGKNKKYSLNFENKEIVKKFIFSVEYLKTIYFYKKYPLIKEISEKIQKHIKGVAIIFGSYVKGNPKKNSDLDLLIIGGCNEKEIEKLEKIYHLEINMIVYPKLKKDILIKEVIKDHIILIGVESFIEEIINE